MSSDTIDRILRYGAGAEFAELYQAVRELEAVVGGGDQPATMAHVGAVLRAYWLCDDSLSAFEAEIDKFKSDPSDNREQEKGDAEPTE